MTSSEGQEVLKKWGSSRRLVRERPVRGSKREKNLSRLIGGPGMACLRAGDRRLGLLSGFIAVPILSLVVWTVNEEAWGAMTSPVAREALSLSMKTTAATMVILVVVGTPAAYVLARGSFRGAAC